MVRRRRRAAGLIGPVLALTVAGCHSPPEGYPEQLSFPARADLIVDRVPNDPAPEPGPLGQLDEEIGRVTRAGGRASDPANLSPGQRAQLQRVLAETFGTPARPTVTGDAEVQELVGRLHLGPEELAAGSRLYRRHCQQCHGLSGDGRGPTGPWIYPHPRDFRQGQFKFVSTDGGEARKPCREDLVRTLRNGIPGTSMPAFGLLADAELESLAGYVAFLSLRGNVEYGVEKSILTGADSGPDCDVAIESREELKTLLGWWAKAETDRLPPREPALGADGPTAPADAEAVRRGYRLFIDAATANCVSCHADFGRQSQYRFDAWGTVVRPANLTAGAFKGGKRPIDLYWRLRGGIGPSRMPAAPLGEGQLWDLVRFVQALPYPARLPDDVRTKVYPVKSD